MTTVHIVAGAGLLVGLLIYRLVVALVHLHRTRAALATMFEDRNYPPVKQVDRQFALWLLAERRHPGICWTPCWVDGCWNRVYYVLGRDKSTRGQQCWRCLKKGAKR